MSAALPMTLLAFLLAWMLSFLQWLHGYSGFAYGVIFFGAGVLASLGAWLFVLSQGDIHGARLAKRQVALKLILLLIFAFSMTFIMMFMYYWLNDEGHVHGASSGSSIHVSSDAVIGDHGRVQLFTAVHLKGYLLPVSAVLNHKQMSLAPGVSQMVTLTLQNQSSAPVALRMITKASPAAVKNYIQYQWLHQDQTLLLAPNEKKQLQSEVSVNKNFPSDLQPCGLTHFIFGADDVSAWQKMQGPIQLITKN